MKKIDAFKSKSLVNLVERLNKENVTKEDIVQAFCNNEGEYVVIIYK